MSETIRCLDREDAKRIGDSIGWGYIDDWIYEPDGKVILVLNDSVISIPDAFKKHIEKRFQEVI